MNNLLYLGGAVILIILNGFFVAAEFALVKVRISRIEQMVREKRPFASTARWLAQRMDESLSACQLGITMASLGLGWVGEPAFANLLEPVLGAVGIHDENVLHLLGFIGAFLVITGLHLVAGEQFPKIFAIRRPEPMLLWCAAPLRFCYIILYPFLVVLNATTLFLLRLVGITGAGEHDGPSTEEEIRVMLREAHVHGNLTLSEHSLINNVFEFDDLIVRRVMVPRGEVAFFDIHQPMSEIVEQVRRSKHTRYPVCDGSLDQVLGVAHIKDLLIAPDSSNIDPSDFDLRTVMRPPKKVPETMPISRVLRHFQATHQLLAFVIDEHGTVTGIVTLENVLEPIVGPVEDEFDMEDPNVVPSGPDEFVVSGAASVEEVRREVGIPLNVSGESDTISGLLMEQQHAILSQGDVIQLDGATAEVLEMKSDRATKIRIRRSELGDA